MLWKSFLETPSLHSFYFDKAITVAPFTNMVLL